MKLLLLGKMIFFRKNIKFLHLNNSIKKAGKLKKLGLNLIKIIVIIAKIKKIRILNKFLNFSFGKSTTFLKRKIRNIDIKSPKIVYVII